MNWKNSLSSFRAKFFLSSFLALFIVPLLVVLLLYNQDIKSTKDIIYSNLNNQANNLSLSLYPSLAFDDQQTAFEQIKGFSSDPMVVKVKIWKKDPKANNRYLFFETYPDQNLTEPTIDLSVLKDRLSEKQITIYKLIKSSKQKLGILSVTRSLDDLITKKEGYLQIGIVSSMSILAIIIIITLWYQSSLTKPMRELSKTATSILKDKDYSVRANKVSKDEFGRLTDIFNEMLDSIEESNSLLRSANEEMEQRVERRTKELTLSNQRITEEMEAKELANEELNKTRQQLSQNEKFANVGQVSSSIAHELRNPLAAIRNSTYYLNLKVKDNKLTKHLKIIDKEISRSDDVIRRLLEITKGEDLKKESTDINFLAKEAMGYADVQNICKLKINFSPKPFKLKIDKLLFRQVLHNLFLNSIQAMPNGGVIELRVTQIKDNWAELIIIDSGQGIKEHLIDKIFEPLYTDKKDGIGLGLSLCKDLISRHGGSIHALSKLNHGTKIIIKIPIT